MELLKPLPLPSIYNEDAEVTSPAMTEILIVRNAQTIYEGTKEGPKPPATPPPPTGGTIRKGGATIRGK